MSIEALQKLLDPQPAEKRAAVFAGEVAAETWLPDELRSPGILAFGKRRDLARARTLASEHPLAITRRRVGAIPAWVTTTEDGGEATPELRWLIFGLDEHWLREVPLRPRSACWFTGTLRHAACRLVVPTRNYAPGCGLVARLGDYGVIDSELAWEILAVDDEGPVELLARPEGDLGPWRQEAVLAVDAGSVPAELAEKVAPYLAELTYSGDGT